MLYYSLKEYRGIYSRRYWPWISRQRDGVGFELGIFGVGAALESISYIYGWTDDLTIKYEAAATAADKLRVKLGESQLELDEELHKIEQTTTANAAAKTAQEREEVELKGIRQ